MNLEQLPDAFAHDSANTKFMDTSQQWRDEIQARFRVLTTALEAAYKALTELHKTMCIVCVHTDLCMIKPAVHWQGCPCCEIVGGPPPEVIFNPTHDQVIALGGVPEQVAVCAHEDIVAVVLNGRDAVRCEACRKVF